MVINYQSFKLPKTQLFTVKWRNRVEQLAANKFRQKAAFLAVMGVLHLNTSAKKPKSTDKIVAPNPSFLLPKFAVFRILPR